MASHIRSLGAKEYHSVTASGLDYVIMFVPIEGALALALQEKPELTSLAAECNVAVATPATLMVMLRTIANVWQVERRNKNAEEIADRAGKLFDKFVGFVEDMNTIGQRVEGTKKAWSDAMNKLSSGRGNLVRQADQMRVLGARTNKSLPVDLAERAEDSFLISPRRDGDE